MKSTTLFALFLLSAFTLNLPSATVGVIVDTDGQLIRNGGSYYILPAFGKRSGGIELAKTGNETCPLTVVQSPSPFEVGLPVTISSPYRVLYITESLPLVLSFTAVPICATTPSWWTLVEGQPEGWAVKLTGYNNTVPGWFGIRRYFLGYKLVFCPLSTDSCGDIGIDVDDDGNWRLVVTEKNPLLVRFKSANHDAA